MRRQLLAGGAAVATAFAVGLAIVALPATATHVEPVTVSGNPTCSDLVPGSTELKVEPVADGTFTDGTLTVTVDVRNTAAGQVFDWTSNIGVDAVFAKGGNSGNLYLYDPEETADTGLHAPANRSGTWAGLSHISFCYGAPDVTTPPSPTATSTPPPSPTPTSTP